MTITITNNTSTIFLVTALVATTVATCAAVAATLAACKTYRLYLQRSESRPRIFSSFARSETPHEIRINAGI